MMDGLSWDIKPPLRTDWKVSWGDVPKAMQQVGGGAGC